MAKAIESARARKIGDPFGDNVLQGPQVDEESYNKILGYIESGKSQGAKLEVGGKKWGNVGYFIEPTVFSNVNDNMKIAQEEVSFNVRPLTRWKYNKFCKFNQILLSLSPSFTSFE